MKYLKTFESKDDDLFWEITQEEWDDLIKKSIDFKTSEIEKLNLLFPDPLKIQIAGNNHGERYIYLIGTNSPEGHEIIIEIIIVLI